MLSVPLWTVTRQATEFCPWNSPGNNTGAGSHSLLQGIFPTQESNQGLLHCWQILHHLSHQGSPFPHYVLANVLNANLTILLPGYLKSFQTFFWQVNSQLISMICKAFHYEAQQWQHLPTSRKLFHNHFLLYSRNSLTPKCRQLPALPTPSTSPQSVQIWEAVPPPQRGPPLSITLTKHLTASFRGTQHASGTYLSDCFLHNWATQKLGAKSAANGWT